MRDWKFGSEIKEESLGLFVFWGEDQSLSRRLVSFSCIARVFSHQRWCRSKISAALPAKTSPQEP
jgi:hypothetical protein